MEAGIPFNPQISVSVSLDADEDKKKKKQTKNESMCYVFSLIFFRVSLDRRQRGILLYLDWV